MSDNNTSHTLPIHPSEYPDISVVIVSWNACKFLEECLNSLSKGIKRTHEVIVVDNASIDGSAEMVALRFPWVRLIRSQTNQGFSKGNNIGIKSCIGQYIALVNSDVNVMPGCLDALADYLDKNPSAGIVGPRIMYGDRRQQSSCRRFPSLWNNTCEVFGLNRVFPRSEFFAGEHMFYFSYDVVREVEVLVGCFLLVRRKALNDFGLLDESFFIYGEDLDWSRRCWNAGWKVVFCPNGEAIHYCGGSSINDPIRFEVAQLRSRLQLWSKHHSLLKRLSLHALLTIQCALRLARAGIGLWFGNSASESHRLPIRIQLACLHALWSRGPANLPDNSHTARGIVR